MMKTWIRCIGIVLLSQRASAQSLTTDVLRATTLRIVELESRRQLIGAAPATIDSLLALYSDSVVYEHPNAGAVVRGKAALRQGMLAYLGSTRSVVATHPEIVIGPAVAVVKTNVRMEVRDGANWTPVTRRGLRVIEFDRTGLVRRLIDYPW